MNRELGTTTQETVQGLSGLNISFRSWRPVRGAQAAMVIVPGFNAHSGYYEWVARATRRTGSSGVCRGPAGSRQFGW